MRKISFFLFCLSLLLSCNCGREPEIVTEQDANGVYMKLPHLWASLLHRGTLAAFSNTFVGTGTVYNDAVLAPTTTSATTRDLTLMRVSDGSRIWSWQCSDIYVPGRGGLQHEYQHDNLLIGQVGRIGYCLDMTTGTTRWIQDRSNSEKTNSFDIRVSGIGDIFFCKGNPISPIPIETGWVYVGYVGLVTTGEIQECLIPHFSEAFLDSGQAGGVGNIIPIVTLQGDTLLSYTFAESFSDFRPATYLGLYNLTKKEWVYDRVLTASPTEDTSADWMKIHKDRVYISVGGEMCCHDLYTGQQLWQTHLPGNLLFSGFVIVDDLFIANCEDTYMYGLDLVTGAQRWKEKSSGTSSKLLELNGVVYFVGGGDGKLHAVEAATGKHLWRLRPPEGSYYNTGPYVIPGKNGGKGHVVARTGMYAYCYEAAR